MIDDYKYPRTMDQAFPGHGDYACAVERPKKVKQVEPCCLLGSDCLRYCRCLDMNYEQAVRLLDRAKDGEAFPLPAINLALELTGDLDATTATFQNKYEQSPLEEML
jgi:hypothetical protein